MRISIFILLAFSFFVTNLHTPRAYGAGYLPVAKAGASSRTILRSQDRRRGEKRAIIRSIPNECQGYMGFRWNTPECAWAN